MTVAGRSVLNLASFNFLGLNNDPAAISLATSTLRRYGVGSCGPPGFYGTLDVHTDLEHAVSEFLGTEESILYSFGFAAVASAIPAYAKKGDVIVADEAVSFALQRGIDVSRANAHFFKHNDMADLERVLEGIDKEHKKVRGGRIWGGLWHCLGWIMMFTVWHCVGKWRCLRCCLKQIMVVLMHLLG